MNTKEHLSSFRDRLRDGDFSICGDSPKWLRDELLVRLNKLLDELKAVEILHHLREILQFNVRSCNEFPYSVLFPYSSNSASTGFIIAAIPAIERLVQC